VLSCEHMILQDGSRALGNALCLGAMSAFKAGASTEFEWNKFRQHVSLDAMRVFKQSTLDWRCILSDEL
jgi:hypothetical protein